MMSWAIERNEHNGPVDFTVTDLTPPDGETVAICSRYEDARAYVPAHAVLKGQVPMGTKVIEIWD